MPLNRKKEEVKKLVNEVETEVKKEVEELTKKVPISMNKVVSTGSTHLDLAISGKRRLGGGIPGGIILEMFGPEASGKTALLMEIVTSTQQQGGIADVLDPESRLDREYARIYGVNLSLKNYYRPKTVTQVFEHIYKWRPTIGEKERFIDLSGENNIGVQDSKESICTIGVDSLAALSTDLELEKGDKMGMRRAKEFSEGFRKTATLIGNSGWLIACTNQMREGDYGETTPGGKAIRYYSSLRIRVKITKHIERKVKLNGGKEVSKVIGVESLCYIAKSTVDDPYREAKIYIIFGYGVDDIRGNLQYIKDVTGETTYICPDGKKYLGMEQAIKHVEEENLQRLLKRNTINLWNEVEEKFKIERRPKERN